MTTHELSCDVLVAGGGPAGVPCALAAARYGARTILCQDRHVLGGNASSEVRMHIVGADASGSRGQALQTEAREGGIIEEIRLETSVRNPQRSASMLDLILYEKCRAEPNLTLMLNTTVVGVTKSGNRITHALGVRQSTEDNFRIAAQIFIDCTGDGRMGAEAGAAFRHGREAKEEFGESLGQERADDRTLGSTLLFTARRHDHAMPFTAPPWVRKFSEEDLKFRPHAQAGIDQGCEYGYWWVEWGGCLDTIKDNEKIRDELMAIMLGVWDHIKNGPPPTAGAGGAAGADPHGATHWALEWFSFLPGKRESRRFVGQHTLTQDDVMSARPQPDAIAFAGWPIDTHPPEGIDAPHLHPCDQLRVPHLYDVPLRCCVSRDIDNLMFAGRNISATHIAFASTRVMATCAAIGQGAGTAAAYAAKHGLLPSHLAANPDAMRAIQQRLLRDDVFLIGQVNQCPDDVAQRAKVSASSEQPNAPAIHVVSGQTRAVDGPGGVSPGRTLPGVHRWMSAPSSTLSGKTQGGLPAWLELRWDQPIRAAEVRLIFDTGMHRPLTLSHSDAYVQKMAWGRAQPETVRDYTIQGWCDGHWSDLVKVTGNYQRLRVHRIEQPPLVAALRVTITATNGLDHARVFEVRVYESVTS